MLGEALPCHFLPARIGAPVVAIRIDRDAAARRELPPHLDVLRIHQLDEVLHDDVHAILVEIPVIAKAEQVELERFALNHTHIRNI